MCSDCFVATIGFEKNKGTFAAIWALNRKMRILMHKPFQAKCCEIFRHAFSQCHQRPKHRVTWNHSLLLCKREGGDGWDMSYGWKQTRCKGLRGDGRPKVRGRSKLTWRRRMERELKERGLTEAGRRSAAVEDHC